MILDEILTYYDCILSCICKDGKGRYLFVLLTDEPEYEYIGKFITPQEYDLYMENKLTMGELFRKDDVFYHGIFIETDIMQTKLIDTPVTEEMLPAL